MIEKIKEAIEKERKIVREMSLISAGIENVYDESRKMIEEQEETLQRNLIKTNAELLSYIENSNLERSLGKNENIHEIIKKNNKEEKKKEISIVKIKPQKYKAEKISEFDRNVIKRLKKKEKEEKGKKETKPSEYVKLANKIFSARVRKMFLHRKFVSLEKDLIKSNLGYTPTTYISLMFLSILISFAVSFFMFGFFMFFNISETGVITPMDEDFFLRFTKTFWLMILIPGATSLFMYLYPSMERKSLEAKLNHELPFATIHMAAISGSRIEPTKIFLIVAMTKEYPHLEKEFNKLLNEINVYGYDLVTALKDSALNSPSQKLADLFNGLATTITSGGDLYDFFDKRAQTLLFDYRLDREKQTKAAETFMDIYISVVIAAPMILMLLLVMMKISGLGISVSTTMLTVLVAGGVSLINVVFLVFLQIKQQAAGGA